MNLPKSEILSQIDDIKRMLLPEMLPYKLHALGIPMPVGENNALYRLHVANYKGLELLRVLEGRIPKCLRNGSPESVVINDVSYQTEISILKDHLNTIGRQLKELQLSLNPNEGKDFNWNLFYNIIETAILTGYFAGAHDMKTPTERHANSGFIQKVLIPQAGGKKTATRTIPVQNLITAMADFVMMGDIDGKVTKSALVDSIFNTIKDFSKKGNNLDLPALIVFPERFPSSKFINKYLKGYDFSKSKGMSKVSTERLKELIQTKFTTSTIKKYIC